jgi:RHS repeat-associated protein
VASYGYDGANRRASKTIGSLVRHYYYTDLWQVLEERLNTTGSERRFVWGIQSIDDLILRDQIQGGGGGGSSSSSGTMAGVQRLYALSDAMGSVTAVLGTSATVLERYGYDGFGAVRYMTSTFAPRTASSYTWETLFDGYRHDAETGFYQVRYRYLHPKLGRWVTRDPINEDELVLYKFSKNNYPSVVDPLGLFDQSDVIKCMQRCDKFCGSPGIPSPSECLKNCYANCDIDPSKPPSPIPPLPATPPIKPPAKPLLTIIKEGCKLLYDWWKTRKQRRESE